MWEKRAAAGISLCTLEARVACDTLVGEDNRRLRGQLAMPPQLLLGQSTTKDQLFID